MVFINELPDDILMIVLSKLNLREAVRTSILSSKWRNLWKFLHGILDINVSDIFGEESKSSRLSNYKWKKFLRIEDAMYNVLRQHQAPTIDELRIRFQNCLIMQCFISERQWKSCINKAIEKREKTLVLDLTFTSITPNNPFRSLPGGIPLPLNSQRFSNLESLVCLRLIGGKITSHMIENLLSNSPLLEILSVKRASCFSDSRQLKICGQSLKLKKLNLRHTNIKYLEISAPKLVSLQFGYHSDFGNKGIRICYENVPCLTQISFIGSYSDKSDLEVLLSLLRLGPQLEALALEMKDYLPDHILHFPNMKNLKQLNLRLRRTEELRSLYLLMEASPSLLRLSLRGPLHDILKVEHLPKPENLQSIKVVELVRTSCFSCLLRLQSHEGEFLLCLAQNATSLDKIIINDSKNFYGPTSPSDLEELRSRLSASVELKLIS